jgi:hypothetical protein
MNEKYNKILEIVKRDRRVCERLSVALDIFYSQDLTLEVNSPSWKGPYKIENIGGEGISFVSDEELPVKTQLSFKFTLPGQNVPMIVTGSLIWCRLKKGANPAQTGRSAVFTYGVQFDKIKEQFERQFIDFISEAIMEKYIDNQGRLRSD